MKLAIPTNGRNLLFPSQPRKWVPRPFFRALCEKRAGPTTLYLSLLGGAVLALRSPAKNNGFSRQVNGPYYATYHYKRVLDHTPRISTLMSMKLSGCTLLALLRGNPASGYDLRKTFAATSPAGLSDSPGATYPALRRLETSGLVRGKIENSSGLRQRKLYRLTPRGAAALRSWLTRRVEMDNVIYRMDELMLRFAFLESLAGKKNTLHFLLFLEGRLRDHVVILESNLHPEEGHLPRSETLLLEGELLSYEARLRWATYAVEAYRGRSYKRRRTSR